MKIRDGKVIITAIISITILDIIALLLGHDGIILTTAVGIIAALAGWTAPQPKFIKR